MKKKLVCSSVVTKKAYKEFLLLSKSLDIFYDVDWYISVDDFVNEKEKNNCNCINIIDSDEGTHGSNDPEKNRIHMKMMMTKFDACEKALSENSYVLFLDSDVFFVNKISDQLYDLMTCNNGIDAILSPHHTENKNLESQVGYYNGGMFCIKNKNILNSWKKLSLAYKKYGMYFEQQPLEYSTKDFVICHFPIQYNIGWWRMNEKNTKARIATLGLNPETNEMFFLGKEAINFHVHTLKKLDYKNYGAFMLEKILACLKDSTNQNHKKILDFYIELSLQEII
jgi:hypothetical protein